MYNSKNILIGIVILIIFYLIFCNNKNYFGNVTPVVTPKEESVKTEPIYIPSKEESVIKSMSVRGLQDDHDKCIFENKKNVIFSEIAKKCKIPDNYNCNSYFKDDKNNSFKSTVIDGKCIPISIQTKAYITENAKFFRDCKDIVIKFYDKDGNILTYDEDKKNTGFVKYDGNIFDKFSTAIQMNMKCNDKK